jgi:tRNA pseudouridine38-40 synthase
MGDTARWKITLAYRGTAFHGFAAQPGIKTVAGDLGDALARLSRLETAPQITCAGRTDAGVHASGQVIHVDLPNPLPSTRDEVVGPESLVRRLNSSLGSEISIIDAELVDEGFDARHSATSRSYRYLIHEAGAADPLLEGIVWHVPHALDLRAMNQAIASFIGEHDFRAFCRRAPGTTADDPIVRRVTSAGVRDASGSQGIQPATGRLLAVDISAKAFCHQMVRSIVGQVVDIGRHRSTAADIVALLRAGTREGAAQPAPSAGLCLVEVGYEMSGLPEVPDPS